MTTRRSLLIFAYVFCFAGNVRAQVVNSDFSGRAPGDYGWPASWSAEKSDRGSVYRLVDDDGHSGKDCLRYQCAAARPAGAVAQTVTCKANTQYSLDAWFKSDGALRPAVIAVSNSEPKQEIARVVADTTTGWHHKSVGFNSAATQKLRVMIYGDVTILESHRGAVGFSAIDDVQIKEKAQTVDAAEQKWQPCGENVALHKPYTFSRPPNYGLCTDPDDKIQLTDGLYTVGYFWTQKSSVGWTAAETYPVAITIDLGQVEPICGVSYSTAAGVAGVHWPHAIYIMTSDDNKAWFLAGDLVKLDTTTKEPPAPDVYGNHHYATNTLATRGRYVALLVDSDGYVFCDEIEVYRSPNALREKPQGKPISAPLDYYWRGMRLQSDLDTIADRLKKATRLSASERQKADQQLQALQEEMGKPFPPLPKETPAILPLNDLQARIFTLNGIALRGLGLPPLFAWKKHRYDPLAPIEQPEPQPKSTASLTITMMNNEWRGDAFVLTNASGENARVRLRISGLPGGDNPSYLSIRDVPFVDSSPRVDVASALPEAQREGKDYMITIPAGMNRQVWVMAHPTSAKPGAYQGTLVVTGLRAVQSGGGTRTLKVPLRLRISEVRFPDRPRMHLGGWDYTNEAECYDVKPTNRDLLIAYLKSRYVDAPWASGGVLPGAAATDFDAEGQLVKQLDFSRLDDWIWRWEGARVFLAFLNVQDNFAGVKMGTPKFNAMVSSWMKSIGAHLKTKGLRPDQLGVLIWDEPNSEEHGAVIRAWADAIHQAGTGILVWEDPQFQEPQNEWAQKVLSACDVMSPIVGFYLQHDEVKRDAYRKLISDRRKLWFYNAAGPTRALDPYSYYRLQHWLCFREGAEGSCFWAFGDAGGGSSWNERASDRGSGYAPEYLNKDSVTDSKQMMGIVEGVQDYEYLSMLKDRVRELEAKGVRSPALTHAKKLLHSAPNEVLAGLEFSKGKEAEWRVNKDRSVADRMCEWVLTALEDLANPH